LVFPDKEQDMWTLAGEINWLSVSEGLVFFAVMVLIAVMIAKNHQPTSEKDKP